MARDDAEARATLHDLDRFEKSMVGSSSRGRIAAPMGDTRPPPWDEADFSGNTHSRLDASTREWLAGL